LPVSQAPAAVAGLRGFDLPAALPGNAPDDSIERR